MTDSKIEDEDVGTSSKSKSKSKTKGFVKYIYQFFKWVWKVLLVPFQLLMNLAHIINEVRMLTTSILTLLILAVVLLMITIIFKPSFAWEPLKNFLNNDLKVEVMKEVNPDEIYKKISLTAIGTDNVEFQVKLNETEVTQLFRRSGLVNSDTNVVLEKDILKAYMNVDMADKPLWVIVEMKKADDGNIKIDNIGFNRFSFPSFMSGMVNSGFSGVTDILAKQNGKDNAVVLFNQIMDKTKFKYQLNKIEFEQDNAILYSYISK
jgi:hypothetical protein